MKKYKNQIILVLLIILIPLSVFGIMKLNDYNNHKNIQMTEEEVKEIEKNYATGKTREEALALIEENKDIIEKCKGMISEENDGLCDVYLQRVDNLSKQMNVDYYDYIETERYGNEVRKMFSLNERTGGNANDEKN